MILFYFRIILSSNEFSQHQTLKVDIGQDVILSCQFDEEKIDQVRIEELLYEEKKNKISFLFNLTSKIRYRIEKS